MCNTNTPGTAIPTTYTNNETARVTEWRFKQKGDNTGWHVHEYDYVVVPLFTGVLEVDMPDGSTVRSNLVHGVPYFRQRGVHHDVKNGNDFECAFVEIEIIVQKQS